tara:strand:+ start:888 stop:1043 length:156 start_codon:yes stop_codon:yes gene_type:complete
MKAKAILIDGHLVKLDDKGTLFRLNGLGVWTQISTKELFNLIQQKDEKEID